MKRQKLANDEQVLRSDTQEASKRQSDLFPEISQSVSPQELQRLLTELKVRQVQLELQNEELRKTEAKLEAAKERYFDLYDLAPLGYLTASEQGLISESNLTICHLLGVARQALVMAPVSRFIATEDQDRFYLHRRKLFRSGQPQSFGLRLRRADQTTFQVQLDACLTQGPNNALQQRIAITNLMKERSQTMSTDTCCERLSEHPGVKRNSTKSESGLPASCTTDRPA